MKKPIHHQKGVIGSKFMLYINTQQRTFLELTFCFVIMYLEMPLIQSKNLRDTRVKVVFPFPKSGLLCKEIITLRLLPHVIKGHTFAYRPSSHLKDLIQQTWNNHYYHHLRRSITVQKWETNQIVIVLITLQNNFILYWPLKNKIWFVSSWHKVWNELHSSLEQQTVTWQHTHNHSYHEWQHVLYQHTVVKNSRGSWILLITTLVSPCWPVLNENPSHKLLALVQNFYIPPLSKQRALLWQRQKESNVTLAGPQTDHHTHEKSRRCECGRAGSEATSGCFYVKPQPS